MDAPTSFELFSELPPELQSEILGQSSSEHLPRISRNIRSQLPNIVSRNVFFDKYLRFEPTDDEIKDYLTSQPVYFITATDDDSANTEFPVNELTEIGHITTFSMNESLDIVATGYNYIAIAEDTDIITIFNGGEAEINFSDEMNNDNDTSSNPVHYYDVYFIDHVMRMRLKPFGINNTVPYVTEYLNRMKDYLEKSSFGLPLLFQFLRANARMLRISLSEEERDFRVELNPGDGGDITEIQSIIDGLFAAIVYRVSIVLKQ